MRKYEGKIYHKFSGYPGGRVPSESDIFQAICKIAKKTKSLGGDNFNEEDLILGFEDLRDGKWNLSIGRI